MADCEPRVLLKIVGLVDSRVAVRNCQGERPAIDVGLAARLPSLVLCGPPDCDIPESAYSC
jgi:hypothetical protein